MRVIEHMTAGLALLVLAGCGGQGGADREPLNPDAIQLEALEKAWNSGKREAQRILCREFKEDPAAFSRDFTKVGKDSVVRNSFADKRGEL